MGIQGELHEILLDRLASQLWSVWVFLDIEQQIIRPGSLFFCPLFCELSLFYPLRINKDECQKMRVGRMPTR